MEKNFKKGDIIVVTTQRTIAFSDVASDHWVAKYDRDITFEEAKDIHYKNMIHDYPGMNITPNMIERVLKELGDKFFLTENGEVYSYDNHELADSFDMLYLTGQYSRSEVAILKDKYIREFDVKATKFPNDEWSNFRIYDDISEWLTQQKS